MIHAYELHGSHIVLDVNSGSVHVTDPVVFHAITHWGLSRDALSTQFPDEDLTGLLEVIQSLIDQRKLFSPGITLPTRQEHSEATIKALCLHVSHACNLTCEYCFAGAGRYQGKEDFMPFEIGRRALDFLLESSGGRRNLEVDFFGGEPLMNWQAVKDLVAYARSKESELGKHFRFTLTTNGVLVDDEVIAFANREMDNVVLSLDGRKDIHDRLRRTANQKGSYGLVVPKLQTFAKARGEKNYYIRGTFTHYNPDFTNDLYHMADLGFRSLSMEPVVCAPGSPYALTPDDIEIVKSEYEKLALEMARRRGTPDAFSFYHYNIDLKYGPCIHKRVAGCGSGRDYLAVTPAGELYPCHRFVGEPAFCMGDVWRGVTRPDLRGEFSSCALNDRPACRDCWVKYYCAGGCAASAYHAGGSILGVYPQGCEMFKKRMECAIWLAAGQ